MAILRTAVDQRRHYIKELKYKHAILTSPGILDQEVAALSNRVAFDKFLPLDSTSNVDRIIGLEYALERFVRLEIHGVKDADVQSFETIYKDGMCGSCDLWRLWLACTKSGPSWSEILGK